MKCGWFLCGGKKKKKRKTSFFFGFKVCQVIFHKMQNVSMVWDAFMMMEPGINGWEKRGAIEGSNSYLYHEQFYHLRLHFLFLLPSVKTQWEIIVYPVILLYVKCFTKPFKVAHLSPFYRWRNWNLEKVIGC